MWHWILLSQDSQASKECMVPAHLAHLDFQAAKEIKEEQDSQVFVYVLLKCECSNTFHLAVDYIKSSSVFEWEAS